MKKLLLIDGDAVLHPHFHKANQDYIDPQGNPVGMLYRSFNTFKKFFNQFDVEHVAIAFDPLGKTSWRYKKYPGYKPGRLDKTENFLYQKKEIMELLTAFGIPFYFHEDYESDDWIASATEHAVQEGFDHIYVGAQDKDLYKILKHPQVHMMHPIKLTPFTKDDLYQKWFIHPEQIDDFLTLFGDSTDGFPGVEGWGKSFVSQMLQKYHTLENIIAHQHEIDGVKGENLRSVAPLLIKQRDILSLLTNVPVTSNDWLFKDINQTQVLSLLKKHGFNYWYKEMFYEFKNS